MCFYNISYLTGNRKRRRNGRIDWHNCFIYYTKMAIFWIGMDLRKRKSVCLYFALVVMGRMNKLPLFILRTHWKSYKQAPPLNNVLCTLSSPIRCPPYCMYWNFNWELLPHIWKVLSWKNTIFLKCGIPYCCTHFNFHKLYTPQMLYYSDRIVS